jgi:hypothetical protein
MHDQTYVICIYTAMQKKKKKKKTGLLKRGFRVTACWVLKKMFKLYTLRFNAGNWTSEQCLCDSLMNSSCYTNNLKSILYSLLQDVDLLTGIRIWFSTTFSSCSSEIREQCVSGTTDRMRQNYSMACSFLWFKTLDCYPCGRLKSTAHVTEVNFV